MNFKCNRISISDETLGCTITFYEKEKEEIFEDRSIHEIVNSIGTYLLIQRTYPEDEYENDYYYIEMNDDEKCGELTEFKIELNRDKIKIEWDSEKSIIELNIDKVEYEKLKDALKIITLNKGELIIDE